MDVVADYRIITRLGRGTAGAAYLAEAPSRLGLREPCVVKVLDRAVADDEFQRVSDELTLVAALPGARVVELLEVGLHHTQLFTVQRFYPEGGLDRGADHSELTRLQAVADAAVGVHALHEAGVVHRQVTPGNVLVAGGRGLVSEPGLGPLVAPGLTSTGAGTLMAIAYLEPEVIWGEPAGRATDIWGLGVTLHQALTGQNVYPNLPDDSVAGTFRHILHARPVLDDSLPPATAEIIQRCLAPRRADRYATALDLARAVAALVPGDPSRTGTAPAEPELPTDARVVRLTRADDDARPEVRTPLTVDGATEVSAAPTTGVVVQGRRCARGHLNAPDALTCARCGIKLVAGGVALVEGIRPTLGVLTVDDGTSLPLVRDVVVGREPSVDELVIADRAVALRVVDSGRTLSRAHAIVRLVEWGVFVEDRASANGTFVRAASHQPWRRLAAGERVALTPGASVRLGERELTFDQH